MTQLSRLGLTTLTFFVLCLGAASVARADTISFIGSRTATFAGAPNIVRCGVAPPNVLIASLMSIGTSNLGAFTTAESRCVNTTTGALFNGLFTFNFANGSTFFGTDSGTVVMPPVNGISPVSLTFNITGGTGLFAGATGSLLGTGQTVFNQDGTATQTLNFNGTITTVPEPTTLLLLGTGLAAIAAKVRRRRKAPCDGDVT